MKGEKLYNLAIQIRKRLYVYEDAQKNTRVKLEGFTKNILLC